MSESSYCPTNLSPTDDAVSEDIEMIEDTTMETPAIDDNTKKSAENKNTTEETATNDVETKETAADDDNTKDAERLAALKRKALTQERLKNKSQKVEPKLPGGTRGNLLRRVQANKMKDKAVRINYHQSSRRLLTL